MHYTRRHAGGRKWDDWIGIWLDRTQWAGSFSDQKCLVAKWSWLIWCHWYQRVHSGDHYSGIHRDVNSFGGRRESGPSALSLAGVSELVYIRYCDVFAHRGELA